MRLAFYYNNRGLKNIDYSSIHEANPGIGGTQYMMIQLVYYLNRYYNDKYHITLYCLEESLFLPCNDIVVLDSFKSIIKDASKCNLDYFIVNHDESNSIQELIESAPIKFIIWGHNYYFAGLADWICKTDNVVANVFIGSQQYDRYIDHDIINKSTIINNMILDTINLPNKYERGTDVVYMGAITLSKGFHLLAKMWKDILQEVPNAQLHVIGGGRLYSRNEIMGEMGIAEAEYEKLIMSYLRDDNTNNILSSVKFHGLLGNIKNDIFLKAKVGVVNPSARTEIFSISIMEMAICALPVVTLNKNGFPDSIINNKTGFLCSNQTEIKNNIINMLKNGEEALELGLNAKEYMKNFSPEVIVSQWNDLFEELSMFGCTKKKIAWSKPISNNYKYIRIANKFLRKSIGLSFLPSIIDYETAIYKFLSLFRRKM